MRIQDGLDGFLNGTFKIETLYSGLLLDFNSFSNRSNLGFISELLCLVGQLDEVLTLDQLQKEQQSVVHRCFLYQVKEESINQTFLLCYVNRKVLLQLLFSLLSVSLEISSMVRETSMDNIAPLWGENKKGIPCAYFGQVQRKEIEYLKIRNPLIKGEFGRAYLQLVGAQLLI